MLIGAFWKPVETQKLGVLEIVGWGCVNWAMRHHKGYLLQQAHLSMRTPTAIYCPGCDMTQMPIEDFAC